MTPENKYLTFKIISGGSLFWRYSGSTTSSFSKTIDYKINNNDWVSLASTIDASEIVVSTGDIVRFRGRNDTYGVRSVVGSGVREYYNYFSASTGTLFEVEGDIMSMIEGDDILTDLNPVLSTSYGYHFQYFFKDCTGLTSTGNLVLSPKVLREGSYKYMFSGCTNLSAITCLATDITATNCTNYWLYNVAATGTITTPSTTQWATGVNGIPSGWTRVNSDT